MDFGRMDRRVELHAAAETRSDSGARVFVWSVFATVWAEVRDKPAREIDLSGRTEAQQETVFFIRYRADVTPRQRVFYGGQSYDIQNVREIGRREGLELLTLRFTG